MTLPFVARHLLRVRQVFDPQPTFPRIMLHEGVNGRGAPLVSGGIVIEPVARRIARFNYWCVSPVDLYHLYPDAIRRVKALNPKIKVLAHVLGPILWPSFDGWPGRLWSEIRGRWFDVNGTPYAELTDPEVVNVLLTAYAELLTSGLFDGIMVDNVAPSDTWRTGFLPEWDEPMREGKGRLIAGLRARFPKAIIIGNGGPRGTYPGGEKASGWWIENFPEQNPYGWDNCITGPLGLISATSYYHRPGHNVIATTAGNAEPSRARWALASSCLGDGIFVWGPGNFDPAIRYMDWWMPEYGTDANRYGGWLGPAAGPAYEHQPGEWRRDFQNGYVVADKRGGSVIQSWRSA